MGTHVRIKDFKIKKKKPKTKTLNQLNKKLNPQKTKRFLQSVYSVFWEERPTLFSAAILVDSVSHFRLLTLLRDLKGIGKRSLQAMVSNFSCVSESHGYLFFCIELKIYNIGSVWTLFHYRL